MPEINEMKYLDFKKVMDITYVYNKDGELLGRIFFDDALQCPVWDQQKDIKMPSLYLEELIRIMEMKYNQNGLG